MSVSMLDPGGPEQPRYQPQPRTPSRQQHQQPPLDLLDGANDSDDAIGDDQDGAQAVLQPAMSAAASHLTSLRTPAAEKAAALESLQGGGLFDLPPGDNDGNGEDAFPDLVPLPETNVRNIRNGFDHGSDRPTLPPGRFPSPQSSRPAPPSPWRVGHPQLSVNEPRSQQSRGFLETAFGPTRHRRSKSAGQEALRRLQKAFPSLSVPSHLLPSLPSSFLSNFTENKPIESSPLRSGGTAPNRASLTHRATAPTQGSPRHGQASSRLTPKSPSPPTSPPTASGSSLLSARPPMLRRVTSDDSILYHSLSRASSLGDDDRFQDVREMVNIRLMAIRDSLPEVPNFKMPTLAKLQAASRKSSISLNAMFSNDFSLPPRPTLEREGSTTSVGATTPKDPATALDRVLEDLTGDLVVLGGYRGSVLRSAEPPHHQLWAPVKIGLNMRKANLEVGLDEEDEDTMEERIIPSGMLKHIGPIDISRKLFKKLRSCDNARSGKLRVWDYGYDWRLSPDRLSRRLQAFLEGLPSNQPGQPPESRGAMVIAHSLGGVITRHVVNQRPELFAGVLYAGSPQRCINILGPFRNGDAVLFNEKLLTAAVNFSIRTSFIFLPDDGFCFVDKATGEEYPIDFHDPEHWLKYRLSPCLQQPLPAYNRPPQNSSSLSSLFPNSLRARSDSKSEKKATSFFTAAANAVGHASEDVSKDRGIAPQMQGSPAKEAGTVSWTGSGTGSAANGCETPSSSPGTPSPLELKDPEQRRYFEYLRRTLAIVHQFRAELAHSPAHRDDNTYPPLAVLYGKTIPTVYACQVSNREAIPCADAYDDLLFRPGDGVVLAKEAMLPEGYSIVRGGRISTERGHLTMLGDMPAVGRALEALIRGRRKGIGLGKEKSPKLGSSNSP